MIAAKSSNNPKPEHGKHFRKFDSRPLNVLVQILSISIPLWAIVYILNIPLTFGTFVYEQQHMSIVLGLGLILTFLISPAHKQDANNKVPWYDLVLIFLTIIGLGYVILFAGFMTDHWGMATRTEQVLGVITLILILEATRRLVGWAMVIIALLFVAYVLFGDFVPGLFHSKNYPLNRVIGNYYVATMGIYGKPLQIISNIVLAYVFFANLMVRSGAGDFIIRAVMTMVGGMSGGSAKVAVLASAAFGTLSGSTVSNATATGSITIPLMKRSGYSPEFAAGVEATASTGGLIMPPVMGPNAFMMAEFLAIPYLAVVKAAIFPAILYFLSAFFQVHFEAAKNNLMGVPREELPRLKNVFLENYAWQFLIPLAVLVGTLVVLVYPPEVAALWAAAALILVRLPIRKTRDHLLKVLVPSLVDTGKGALTIIIATAASGLIIGSVTQTGLIYTLAPKLIELSGGYLLILLILVAISAIVLGMGLDSIGVYVILMATVLPAMVEAGVLPIAAHFFILYLGIMSFITPPVCIVAFATAGIANASPLGTGLQAMRLAIVAFLVPFFFVYDPILLMQQGSALEIALTFATGIFGAIVLAAGISGYLFHNINFMGRVILIAAGILTIIPGWQTDLVGASIAAVMMFINFIQARRIGSFIREARGI